MKICFLTPEMSLGGSSTLIFDLINNWPEKDELFLVVFFNKIDNRYKDNFKRNVHLVFLGKEKTIDFKFLRKLKKTIKEISPDIISTHLTAPFYLSLVNSCRKIKVFHTIHSEPALDLPWFYRIFLKRKIKIGRIKLIGCCDYISKKATKLYKVNCLTATNGLEITNYEGKKNYEPIFLFVGRFTPIKNVPLIIEAFNLTKENNFKLILCGFGSQENYIRELVNTSPKQNNILFVGKTNETDKYYKMANVLLLPSLREGMPITILEAINGGLSIIASRVGGNEQFVIDNHNGFILDEISAEKLSALMNFYIDNPGVLQAHCQNSLELKSKISIKETVKKYKSIFDGAE